jgi:hypothetical protein
MNFAQLTLALVATTSCCIISASGGDFYPDLTQLNNSEQQLQTDIDKLTPTVDQEFFTGENVFPPPAALPPVDRNQSDDENIPAANSSVQPNPNLGVPADSDVNQETIRVATVAIDTSDPVPATAQERTYGAGSETDPRSVPEPSWESNPSGHFKPQVLISWQLQLQGNLTTSYDAKLYVLDLFDTPQSKIASLQRHGIAVICYFSAGTFEDWRADSSEFDESDLGQDLDDWPGERWLDVRSQNVRRIMTTRLDLARSKGCDGVDPDNVDGHSNQTGINLSNGDQLSFNKFLSDQAHRRGLAIGLKNNMGQVEDLVDYYDFAINESCDLYHECDSLSIFIDQGKPVLHVEYRPDLLSKPAAFNAYCQEFMNKQFSSLVLPRALDDEYRLSCQ